MKFLFACLFLVTAAQASEWTNLRPVTRTKPVLRHNTPDSHIIGGSFATTGQFKYQVAVLVDGSGFCGGSLITNSVVLTGGLCVYEAKNWEILAGALYFPSEQEPGHVIIFSEEAIIHENYGIYNDIAVIKLPRSISGPNIGTIRLPSRSQAGDSFTGNIARVSGWGTVRESSPYLSTELKFADVGIISNTVCASYYGFTPDSTLCVDTNGGTEAPCYGDNGSPLVITEFDGLPTEVGISSFTSAAGCDSGEPAVFTRVTEYLDWLETNAGVTIRP